MSNLGFFVVEADDKTIRFESNFQPEVHPSGALGVVEMVPDVGNKNKGMDVPELRIVYAPNQWKRLIFATPEITNDKDD